MPPKKVQKTKFQRAPGAPKRFKSGFLYFSEQQHKRIRNAARKKLRAADVAKMVSQAWKELSDSERAPFLEQGKADRARYEREKAAYQGPWKVPVVKDPDTPKKPMSAFLAFGNERRRALVAANPHLTGNELSCLLAKLWRECPAEVQRAYKDKQARAREEYKETLAQWKLAKKEATDANSTAETTTSGKSPYYEDDDEDEANGSDEGASSSGVSQSTHKIFNKYTSAMLIGDDDDHRGILNPTELASSDSRKPSTVGGTSCPGIEQLPVDPLSTIPSTNYACAKLDSDEDSHDEYVAGEPWPFSRVRVLNTTPPSASTSTAMSPRTISEKKKIPTPSVLEKVSKNANYSPTIEELLEDEELFEDFSPSLVPRVSNPTMRLPLPFIPFPAGSSAATVTNLFTWQRFNGTDGLAEM